MEKLRNFHFLKSTFALDHEMKQRNPLFSEKVPPPVDIRPCKSRWNILGNITGCGLRILTGSSSNHILNHSMKIGAISLRKSIKINRVEVEGRKRCRRVCDNASKGDNLRILTASPRSEQSKAEEIANSISHGIGLVAISAGTPFLVLHAINQESVGFIVGASVFSATVVLLYLASTLYHALPKGKAKGAFRVIEHSVIFLLIAGTYTPFTLGVLKGAWGWSLFGIIWGLAAIGVLLKVFLGASRPIFFTVLYVLMGWVIVIAIDPLLERMQEGGFSWLLAGGLSYTVGVVFFATDSRVRYGHLIWHLFVITGTACHYMAVFFYGA